jgi:hypothetical protein
MLFLAEKLQCHVAQSFTLKQRSPRRPLLKMHIE